jgi:hypothetical protein
MSILARASGLGALLLLLRALFTPRAKRTARRRSRRPLLDAAYQRAAEDPQFARDMDEVSRAFDPTVADGLESNGATVAAR